VPVACGEVAVFPGDIMVGDGEGVVAIPAHLAAQVAEQAAEMERKEEFILQRIRAGASLVGTYPPDEATMAEYEKSKRG
jgi:regulator of RNase E activity RraA